MTTPSSRPSERTPEEMQAENKEHDLRWAELLKQADNQENNLATLLSRISHARASEQLSITEAEDKAEVSARLEKEAEAIQDIQKVELSTDQLSDLRERHELSRINDEAADEFWNQPDPAQSNKSGAEQYISFREQCYRALTQLEINARWQRPGEDIIQREITELKTLLQEGKIIKDNGDPIDEQDIDGNPVNGDLSKNAINTFQVRLQKLHEDMNEKHKEATRKASETSDNLKPLPRGHDVVDEKNLEAFLALHGAVKAPGGLIDQVNQNEFWKDPNLNIPGSASILSLTQELDEAVSEGIIPITKREKKWDRIRTKDVPVKAKLYDIQRIVTAVTNLTNAMNARVSYHQDKGRPNGYRVLTERAVPVSEKVTNTAGNIYSIATATKKRILALTLGAGMLIGGAWYSFTGDENTPDENPANKKANPGLVQSGPGATSGTPTGKPTVVPTITASADAAIISEIDSEFSVKKDSGTIVELTLPTNYSDYGTNVMVYIRDITRTSGDQFVLVPVISPDGKLNTNPAIHGNSPEFRIKVLNPSGVAVEGLQTKTAN